MTTAFPPLSAAVTRILALSGFPAQLKTRDIQSAFNEWENVNGGFKIKWLDDTNLLMVFADAGVAKRAYLQALASPHPIFSSPTGGTKTTIKPYDGADAQTVIQAVNSRPGGGAGHRARASMSAGPGPSAAAAAQAAQAHMRGVSMSQGFRPSNAAVSHSSSAQSNLSAIGREPSPTLPSIPNQPTLNALISSSLADAAGLSGSESSNAGGAGRNGSPPTSENERGAPKIGDPGRRMVGHHLGIRHPGLGNRAASSGGDAKTDSAAAVSSVSD